MFKQDFSDFYKVYSAVHDSKLREEVKSQRDEISEMDLSLFSDKDLIEIAEEVVQELFEKGYKIEDVSVVLSDDTSSSFRKEKLRRINEALDSVVEEVTNNAATTAIESFKLYRAHKKLQERRIEQRGIEEGRIKSAQALNIYTVEKATIKKGLKSILESIKEAATPESGTGKYYREGKPTQQQLDNRAKREKIKQLTNQGKHKEASALHNEHNEEEVVDEAMSSYDKARKAAARRAADRNAARKRGELGGRMERETYTNEAGTRMHHKGYKANANEEVVKEKESYDTVAAVIDYDRSKKGSKDATYDSDHGKKKAAKKERDYAAWEREKMKRDDPNWKHKKYHTGMHGEDKDWGYDKEGNSLNPDDIEAKERKAAKGQVKKELKDVEKAAETLKGKNIAKADKVEEGQSWITSGKFSQEEIDSILEKEEISLGKSQELSEDWLDASIEVAAEYFFSEGINEDGLEQIIEEVGLENFVEFVTDPIDELSEERSARKASVRAPSYEKVKAKVDATDAAKKKAKKGEYASSYAKKETDVTVYDDKPTAKKKAAPAKKPVAKKAPAKKKVVVKKVAPAKKVENQKKVVKSVATTKTKQQPKPASKKGLVGKIRSAVEKGVERHKAARAKGREPEKRVKEFGKGFASGVKSAVKFAGDVKKVVSKEDYETKKKGEVLSAFKRDPKVRKRFEKAAKKDRGPGSVENQAADDMLQTAKDIAKRKGDTSKSDDRYAYESVVGEAKKSKENPKGRHPRDQAELDRAQEYIKKNPNFGKVSEGVTATLNGKSYKLLPDKTREKLKKHGKGGLDGDYRTEVGKVKDAVTDKLGLTNTKRDGVKTPRGHQDYDEGYVHEAKVDAGKSPETKEKERNVRKFGVSHNVSGHGKLRRSLHKMNRGDKKIKGDKSAWVEMESTIPVVVEKDLNAAERRALPNKDFVFPGKGEGPEGKQRGAYPINDKKHARNALAMAAAHASPEKEAKVKAAVKKKFPDIEVKEQEEVLDELKSTTLLSYSNKAANQLAFKGDGSKKAQKRATGVKRAAGKLTMKAINNEEVVSELNRYGKETGKATGSMNKKSGTPVKKGGSTDKALNIVRGMIRKQQGRPEGQQKKTKGVKSDAGTGKYLSKQQDKKDYAAKAKKAGFKDTQSYTDTVARYGGESNYKAGRGLGT